MDDLVGEFLPARRTHSMTEPILPQIKPVLDADGVEADKEGNSSDKVSKKDYDNYQISAEERVKVKLHKTRRLSSGGLMRGQRKRRVKYPMQRANTAPECGLSMDIGLNTAREDKRSPEDKTLQLHDCQTSSSAAVDKTVVSEGHTKSILRTIDMNGKCEVDDSSSTAESNSLHFQDEFDALSHRDSKIDATNRFSNPEPTESRKVDCNVCLENATDDEANTESLLKVLQNDEFKAGAVDVISKRDDIVSSNKSEVHQGTSTVKKSMVESYRSKRWSLPSLRSFKMSQTDCQSMMSTTDEKLNGAFETHGSFLLRGATLQRSISLPNFVGIEQIDDLQCGRLLATKVTDDSQGRADEQTACPSESEKTDITITVSSEQQCSKKGRSKSWPPALIYHLEVSPKESTVSIGNHHDNGLRRSKSLTSVSCSVGNTDSSDSAGITHEKSSVRYAEGNSDDNIAKNHAGESMETEERAQDETEREFIRSRSKSLPAFTCPVRQALEDEHISINGDLNDSSINYQEDAYTKWRSKSLSSVLTGNTEIASRTIETFAKFRDVPRVNPTEAAPRTEGVEGKCSRNPAPEAPEALSGGHVTALTEQYFETSKAQPQSHATDLTEQYTRTLEAQQQSHATDLTEQHMRTLEAQQQNHATDLTEQHMRTLEAQQQSHATDLTEQQHTRILQAQPIRVTELAEQECDSVTSNARRQRSLTLPHIFKLERIVEVPNEYELREQDEETRYVQLGETSPVQCRLNILETSHGDKKRTNRSRMIDPLGRSRSVDYGDLSPAAYTRTVHVQDTCTEELMLEAEDIELTLTGVFEQETSNGELKDAVQVEAVCMEDFNHRLSKFDDILSNIVSSFLEPDYALSSSSLHRAVAKGDLEYVKLLVESGSDVNANDENGLPPLHVAVVSGSYDMAVYLVCAGADLEVYTNTVIQDYTMLKYQVYYNL